MNGTNYELKAKTRFDELLKQMGMENLASQKVKDLKAPMPGLVLDILVSEGQAISKGDAILILEAMKMETTIKTPHAGNIINIFKVINYF